MSLLLQLSVTTPEVEVDDAAGSSFTESGQVFEGPNYVANFFTTYRRTNDSNIVSQNAYLFTTALFFFNSNGPGENLVAQGAFDNFSSSDIGSISAASPATAKYLGQKYLRLPGNQVKIG